MAKTLKITEYKLSTDENLKSYGSQEDFQVHIAALNEKGHRIDARAGAGTETMFVNMCDFNRYGVYTNEQIQSKARAIHSWIRGGEKTLA